MSPTKRTMDALREGGAIVGITEKWNQYAKIRQDLFGFIDLIALRGKKLVAIQCTSGSNHSARVQKIKENVNVIPFLKTGNLIEVWSWKKRGERGKRKTWEARIEKIELPY